MESVLLIGLGLLGLGVLLLTLEAFVPSGGILGIAALASAIAGIVFLFKYDAIWGATGALGTVILGPMVFFWAIKMLPSTGLGRTMVGQSGEEIAQARAQVSQRERAMRLELLNKEGEALTDMRPSGVVVIEGQRHDAISRGGIVDRGERIRVSKVDGISIEVRKV